MEQAGAAAETRSLFDPREPIAPKPVGQRHATRRDPPAAVADRVYILHPRAAVKT
jgi:hypothetical protein